MPKNRYYANACATDFFIGRVYVGFGGWESGFVRFLCAVTNLSQIQKLMRFIGI